MDWVNFKIPGWVNLKTLEEWGALEDKKGVWGETPQLTTLLYLVVYPRPKEQQT